MALALYKVQCSKRNIKLFSRVHENARVILDITAFMRYTFNKSRAAHSLKEEHSMSDILLASRRNLYMIAFLKKGTLSIVAIVLATLVLLLAGCGKGKMQDENLRQLSDGSTVKIEEDAETGYQLYFANGEKRSVTIPLYTFNEPSLKVCSEPVLGYDVAFYLVFPDSMTSGSFKNYRFYGVGDNQIEAIAEGFGLLDDDFYFTGLDENGYPLLAVNVTYEADGAHGSFLYRQSSGIARAELSGGWISSENASNGLAFVSDAGDKFEIDATNLHWACFLQEYTADSGETYKRTLLSLPDNSGYMLADGQSVAVSDIYPYIYSDLDEWKGAVRYTSEDKTGYLNRLTGDKITDAAFISASEMKDGSALVSKDAGQYYYISNTGEALFPDRTYSQAFPFECQGSFARVFIDGSGWAIISRNGEIEIDGYQKINELPDTSNIASGVDSEGNAKWIDLYAENGATAYNFDVSYTDIESYAWGYEYFTIAYRSGLAGIVDCCGKTLLEPQYLSIDCTSYFSSSNVCVGYLLCLQGQDGKYGISLLMEDGENTGRIIELVPAIYDSIEFPFCGEETPAVKDGAPGYINLITRFFYPVNTN